jgi:hypothetical protein
MVSPSSPIDPPRRRPLGFIPQVKGYCLRFRARFNGPPCPLPDCGIAGAGQLSLTLRRLAERLPEAM